MILQQVSSNNLRAVGYDPDTRTLVVEFRSGGTYEFYDVDVNVYEALMSAGSHGQFFQQEVRGRYRYARI